MALIESLQRAREEEHGGESNGVAQMGAPVVAGDVGPLFGPCGLGFGITNLLRGARGGGLGTKECGGAAGLSKGLSAMHLS